MKTKASFAIVALALQLLVSGCQVFAPEPTSTLTNTPTPMSTPSLAATPTSVPPTATPVPPTETPSPTTTSTPTPSGINISGVITNLDEARPYFSKDSYLQLVSMPADGELTIVLTASGLAIHSDLARIPIPPDGVFNFHVDSLKPGRYFVTVQNFHSELPQEVGTKKPAHATVNFMVLLREAGNPESTVVIEIPENVTLPFSFDMGEVAIQLP